jgi:predicted enzyme related to lactoylglutathione lyase
MAGVGCGVAFCYKRCSTVLEIIVPKLIRLLTWLLLACGVGCTAINLPPVTDAPTNTHLPGKVIWHELITDTPEASEAFYTELFGWEFESVGIGFGSIASANYKLIRHNGRLIGGMIDQNRLDTDADISQWIVLIATDDIDRAVGVVADEGGTVFRSPTALADRGHIAIVADPQGALFALLETKDGDPLDRQPDVNDFLWNELWTDDAPTAVAFYQRLAGYDLEGEEAVADNNAYQFLSKDGVPRVGILVNPIDDLAPLWSTYVRVEDPAAMTARVEALGGRVLLAAQERDLGGQVALIAGPSGAGFAIQTWQPRE